MDEFRKTSFTDRITQAAKAREAQLARARAKSPANDPDFAKRQAERADLKVSRDAREARRRWLARLLRPRGGIMGPSLTAAACGAGTEEGSRG